ncbi:MAG: MATE family efflux transporter [Solobacterium sp.]|nr:MATE family efflux transporter [Solobacterium sp.]
MAKDFTKGNPMKVIFTFAVPMLIGNIFQQLYSTVDSIIVGNFEGKNALAAISGSASVQFLILAIAFGFTAGMSVVISQVYGARDYKKLKRVMSTGILFIIGLSVVLGVTGIVIAGPLLRLLGTPAEIMNNAQLYLRIMFIGMPAAFLYNYFASILRAIGDSRSPLYFLIISSLTNIVLDYAFVAFLGWGVMGVAVATVMSQILSDVLCFVYINRKVDVYKLKREEYVFDRDILRAIVNYGLPAAIQQSIVSVSMLFVQSFVNFFGADMMAAFGVSNRIEGFVTMPMMNLAMALSTFAGQNIGAGREKRAISGIRATMIMQAVFCGVMAFVLPAASVSLIDLFGLADDPSVIQLGTMGISFAAKFYILFALFQTLNQFHRGVGDTKFSLVASIFMIMVRIPMTYVLVHVVQLGEISVWMGMVSGWMASLLINTLRFLSGKWRGKAYVQLENAEE